MFDSHICDYNYKCLTYEPIESTYTFCPHAETCNIRKLINSSARGHYNRHSLAKAKKKSYAGVANPSVPGIKAMYQEALRKGFICSYCRKEMTLERNYSNSSTIDHIHARGLGGGTTSDNLILCCWTCNERKGRVEYNKIKYGCNK